MFPDNLVRCIIIAGGKNMQTQSSEQYLTAIGTVSQRLLTDTAFRTAFFENPKDSLNALQLDLSATDLAQLTTQIEAELAQLSDRQALETSLDISELGRWA
jgi:hypothetical protein